MSFASYSRRRLAQELSRGHLEAAAGEIDAALRSKYSRAPAGKLEALLVHASESVPFYQRFRGARLDDFPVVDKAKMLDTYGDFLSNKFSSRELGTVSTSGSTGIPFTAQRDAGKIGRHRAGLVATYRFQGADPFGPRVTSRAWPKQTRFNKLRGVLVGELAHSGGSLMNPSLEEVVGWIQRRRKVTVLGYSSYIEQMLRGFESMPGIDLRDHVSAVIGSAEAPSDYLKSATRSVLDAPLGMRYSCMEFGVVAVTSRTVDSYHIDSSSFVVELLRQDADEPVSTGERGRVVVTDLYNYGMPFIRYDTGDLAEWAVNESFGEDRSILKGFAGRRTDVIYLQEGREAHALQVWAPTSKIQELRQFQLRQHAVGHFTWVLNASQSGALEEKLRAILVERVGNIRECRFEYVTEVPVLASGKRQFFVNEMKNN